jgi:acetyltransferase-like isoleucine patch superfamily enzyme
MKFNNRNVFISPKAVIGRNVRIGDNTTIYDNVTIGDNSTVCNDCIIGEPLASYYSNTEKYENPITILGENAMIRSHCIIYAGSSFGMEFSTGHRATIRENTIFGDGCRVGTLCDIQGDASFGNYCWLHSNVHIGKGSAIGSYVFIYPYVVFTNDPHPPSNLCIGPAVGDYSQIAVFSVLLPGVKVGRHVLVGAGSIVGKDVGDYQLVTGNPAKVLKDVRELISKETGEAHYPWPYHFERGMPWEKQGYELWLKENNIYE